MESVDLVAVTDEAERLYTTGDELISPPPKARPKSRSQARSAA